MVVVPAAGGGAAGPPRSAAARGPGAVAARGGPASPSGRKGLRTADPSGRNSGSRGGAVPRATNRRPLTAQSQERALRERLRKEEGHAAEEPEGEEGGAGGAATAMPYQKELGALVEAPQTEVMSALVTLLLCFCFAYETVEPEPVTQSILSATEAACSGAFTVQYLLRFYVSGMNVSFLLTPLMLVDLLSIVPTFLGEMYRPVSLFRVGRILRLGRLLQQDEFAAIVAYLLGPDVRPPPYTRIGFQVLLTIFCLFFITAGILYAAEPETFASVPNALYFTVTSLTTVGYGDVVPVTPQGKTTVCFAILVGVLLLPYELGVLAQALLRTMDKANVQCSACGLDYHEQDANFCRQCGADLLQGKEGEGGW